MRAQARMLPDGRRLHLQDGPIDLILEALASPSPEGRAESRCARPGWGQGLVRNRPPSGASRLPPPPPGEEKEAVAAAYRAATLRFASILDELCAELGALRAPFSPGRTFESPVARRMQAAIAPFGSDCFITPMAAVAGSVAEEILDSMLAAAPLARASVNNGGDIALYLAPGEKLRIGLVDRPDRPGLFGSATISSEEPVRGIATSGWRGRSFSLGIADAVTVLADSSAQADSAATIVANAVDLPGHPAVTRVPAIEVQCDSDLGDRLVTRDVGALSSPEIEEALARGLACAERLIARGLIRAAALHLQEETRVTGTFPLPCGEGRVARASGRTGVGIETQICRRPSSALFHHHPARADARVRPPLKGEGRRELVS